MPNFISDAIVKVDELMSTGMDSHEATRLVIEQLQSLVILEAEMKLHQEWKARAKREWAEPPERPDQLRFTYEGVELAIPDTRVRLVDSDGEPTYNPAQLTTGHQRLDSSYAKIQHHQSIIRRTESEARREEEQIAVAFDLGLDVANNPWNQVRHQAEGTLCWRCGLSWRAGDPFESGHSDKPESQGGVVTEWEHRSCNRSARDNPVARPVKTSAADLI